MIKSRHMKIKCRHMETMHSTEEWRLEVLTHVQKLILRGRFFLKIRFSYGFCNLFLMWSKGKRKIRIKIKYHNCMLSLLMLVLYEYNVICINMREYWFCVKSLHIKRSINLFDIIDLMFILIIFDSINIASWICLILILTWCYLTQKVYIKLLILLIHIY